MHFHLIIKNSRREWCREQQQPLWADAMQSPCMTFRAALFLAALVLTACGGSIGDDLPLAFSATLTAAEEVPPHTSQANGVGLVTVDPDLGTLTASVVASGMADIDAHIHVGAPGVAGPVVFPLAKAPGMTVWTTRVAITDAQFGALKAGNYYFNVHSTAFPNGEIRGQIAWAMPTVEQEARLQQVRQQSATVELQLHQLDEIRDADDWRFTGVGLGLTIGF
jgi:hypothetical protein